ncbi:MAG: prevent-host-death protein [Nitrospirota bacterium]
MRNTTDTVQKTISATEIKCGGLSVIDKALKKGPVHVLKNNEPAYVIMAEEQYRELAKQYRKSYVSRIRRSLKDLKQGRVRPHTAQTLIDELHLEA